MSEFDISELLSEEDFPIFQSINLGCDHELVLDPIPADANLDDVCGGSNYGGENVWFW